MELDLEYRLMGEALILNISLDALYGDYIELNDLNEPLELRRNQIVDLGPTIEEGEVVDEPMEYLVETRRDNEIIDGFDEYPSYCDFDRKIHIDCTYNLQFSCMIGNEHVNVNFFPLLSINVMSKSFYNSIMKDKIEYKGENVVGAFMNVPIFVGNFSVVTDFVVVENMDAYHDEEMGDIIVGRPFCREACVKARRFDGMITIYYRNNSVTYQMTRSHLRFKHPTNVQCNKMRPLLKVSTRDKLRGLNTAYPGFGIRRIDFVFLALGWHLKEIHMTWAHLEKKQTRLRLYTIYLEELCIQSVETASQASSDGVKIFMVTASLI
ncbi:hypothetical protein Tco_0932137 [Tanacetum coccineum]